LIGPGHWGRYLSESRLKTWK